jgi:hypothetical protein
VVFWGSITGDNRVADADAAYLYFRSLWASTLASAGDGNFSAKRPEFYLERSPIDPAGLQQTVQFIQQNFVPSWWEELIAADEQNPKGPTTAVALSTATATMSTTRRNKPKKLHIHFSLVSSEYQLCQLNDIHIRSPNQSALRSLRALARTSGVSAPHVEPPTWSFHGVTSWLYSPSSSSSVYPTAADKTSSESVSRGRDGVSQRQQPQQQHPHPLRAFCAKTYKTAQDMVPVLYNLRGVVDHREFFQRDNYRALVAARRSLIADMERMYHLQPGLQSVHHSTSPNPSAGSSAATSSERRQESSSPSYQTSSNTSPGWSPSASLFARSGSKSSLLSASASSSLDGKKSHLTPHHSSTGAGGTEGSTGGSTTTTTVANNGNNKPLDVVLESALLSLGRCLDLLRPAGLLTGSVPMEDYKRALTSLQQAYYLLDRACDPDEPLPTEEWCRPLSIVSPPTTETTDATRTSHHYSGRGPLAGLSWWSYTDARGSGGSAEATSIDRAKANRGNIPSSNATC